MVKRQSSCVMTPGSIRPPVSELRRIVHSCLWLRYLFLIEALNPNYRCMPLASAEAGELKGQDILAVYRQLVQHMLSRCAGLNRRFEALLGG